MLTDTDDPKREAVRSARAGDEERRLRLRIEALSKVALRIQQLQDPEEILAEIGRQLEVLGMHNHVTTITPDGSRLVIRYVSLAPTIRAAVERVLRIRAVGFSMSVDGVAPLRAAIRERRATYTRGEDALPEVFPTLPAPILRQVVRLIGLEGVIIAPLLVRGEILGALTVWSRELGPDDVPAIVVFAQQAATAYVAARTLADTRSALEDSRSARAAADEARDSLQRFLAMVAHDLRTPLTAILGGAQLAPRVNEERRHRLLASIERDARRMRRLISDLEDAARIGVSRFRIARGRMDLTVLVRRVVDRYRESDGRRFVVTGPESVVGHWDEERIAQVLDNLISNAAKYSPPSNEIRIEVRADPNAAVVSVHDEGAGLDPEALRTLFHPFAHVDRLGPRATRLGLFISEGIVRAHHGRLWAESPGPGQGSTFCFTLPFTSIAG